MYFLRLLPWRCPKWAMRAIKLCLDLLWKLKWTSSSRKKENKRDDSQDGYNCYQGMSYLFQRQAVKILENVCQVLWVLKKKLLVESFETKKRKEVFFFFVFFFLRWVKRAKEIIEIQFTKYLLSACWALGPGLRTKMCRCFQDGRRMSGKTNLITRRHSKNLK